MVRSLALFLACVLLFSAIEHAKNAFLFVHTIYRYELVGPKVGLWVATILPPSQFLLAAMVFANFWRQAVSILISAMFFMFLSVQIFAFLKGISIPCGCFGFSNETIIGWQSLLWVTFLWVSSIYYLAQCQNKDSPTETKNH